MLIRAGGGTFRKLSIPRDTLAEIPGQGPQKINSAYAQRRREARDRARSRSSSGSTSTRSRSSTSTAFADFIDSIGGIEVDLADRGLLEVSDGAAFNLELDEGENHLDGYEAITPRPHPHRTSCRTEASSRAATSSGPSSSS